MGADVAAPTQRALLADARAALAAGGIADPVGEALRLWADLRGERVGEAFLHHEDAVDGEAAARFLHAVARRAAGEPLAYVTGWTEFRRLVLATDRRALVPRPETEELVELVLARAPSGRAADVGTGTGCIALSLALEGRYDGVVAIDLSADALALARGNARRAGLDVGFLRGDLVAGLAPAAWDVLVSNPPYLTAAEHATLDPSVRDWEPALALPSGPDGLAATRRLLQDGRAALRPGGLVALEVDATRAGQVAMMAVGLGWSHVTVHRDLFGRERFMLAHRSENA